MKRNLYKLMAGVLAGLAIGGGIAHAGSTDYGDWTQIPGHMVGDTCDTIDGGSATIVLGEHALYSDVAGTRFVITMPGRICSS